MPVKAFLQRCRGIHPGYGGQSQPPAKEQKYAKHTAIDNGILAQHTKNCKGIP